MALADVMAEVRDLGTLLVNMRLLNVYDVDEKTLLLRFKEPGRDAQVGQDCSEGGVECIVYIVSLISCRHCLSRAASVSTRRGTAASAPRTQAGSA